MNNERHENYTKRGAGIRNNGSGRFSDDEFKKVLQNMMELDDIIHEILSGDESITSVAHNHKIKMMKLRRIFYIISSMHEVDSGGIKRFWNSPYRKFDAVSMSGIERLYAEVFGIGETTEVFDFMPPDAEATLLEVLDGKHGMTCRESTVLKMRFFDAKSLEDCGKEFNVTRERIRQVEAKALRKLRHPIRANILRKGLSFLDELEAKYEIEKQKKIDEIIELRLASDEELISARQDDSEALNKDISHLNLSVRPYNCLIRAGYQKIGDILDLSEMQLMKIRNMGRRSTEEVLQKIEEIKGGLKNEHE